MRRGRNKPLGGTLAAALLQQGRFVMKVYRDDNGSRTLIGRADIAEDHGPVLEIPLFGAASTIVERYTIGVVTHLRPDGQPPLVERAVLISDQQLPELLPGWTALAS
jgi:hypothetical protein